jgi:6-phosphogluconolactonase
MQTTADIHVVPDVPDAFAQLVHTLEPRWFALSGGSTAKRCYERLRDTGRDWSATRFLLSDERWVPVEHPDSNEGQARRSWLDFVESAGIASLREAGGTPEEAARAYDAVLRDIEDIELLHLGLGDDGHTASLFPGSPALEEREALVVATGDHLHDWPRLSFTFPAISRCRHVVVTVSGESKREAFQRVRAGDPVMPAAHISASKVTWIVDPPAAS